MTRALGVTSQSISLPFERVMSTKDTYEVNCPKLIVRGAVSASKLFTPALATSFQLQA